MLVCVCLLFRNLYVPIETTRPIRTVFDVIFRLTCIYVFLCVDVERHHFFHAFDLWFLFLQFSLSLSLSFHILLSNLLATHTHTIEWCRHCFSNLFPIIVSAHITCLVYLHPPVFILVTKTETFTWDQRCGPQPSSLSGQPLFFVYIGLVFFYIVFGTFLFFFPYLFRVWWTH